VPAEDRLGFRVVQGWGGAAVALADGTGVGRIGPGLVKGGAGGKAHPGRLGRRDDPSQADTMTHPGIGVGTWAWGNRFLWGYNTSQDAELEATFRAAVAADLLFFDTADSYGTGMLNGRSEALLGRFAAALPAQQRDRLCLATKLAPFPWRLGRAGYRRAFAASRHRLAGRIDRVQLHWSTARYAPWQELPLIDGLADLVEQGAVRELGVSNMGPRRLRQVHAHLADRGVRLMSLQVQLSLLAPAPISPGGIKDTCRDLGIELLAYSPLALGLLARRPGEGLEGLTAPRRALFRRLGPGLADLLETMEGIAAAHEASLAAVALNWCRAHGARPIPGLRRVRQVRDVQAALTWQLQEGERQVLDGLAMALKSRMPANPLQSA
jgi:pyridoxine 4-dehydrogenase